MNVKSAEHCYKHISRKYSIYHLKTPSLVPREQLKGQISTSDHTVVELNNHLTKVAQKLTAHFLSDDLQSCHTQTGALNSSNLFPCAFYMTLSDTYNISNSKSSGLDETSTCMLKSTSHFFYNHLNCCV